MSFQNKYRTLPRKVSLYNVKINVCKNNKKKNILQEKRIFFIHSIVFCSENGCICTYDIKKTNRLLYFFLSTSNKQDKKLKIKTEHYLTQNSKFAI